MEEEEEKEEEEGGGGGGGGRGGGETIDRYMMIRMTSIGPDYLPFFAHGENNQTKKEKTKQKQAAKKLVNIITCVGFTRPALIQSLC